MTETWELQEGLEAILIPEDLKELFQNGWKWGCGVSEFPIQ